MPSTLALLFCLTFVLFLLRAEKRKYQLESYWVSWIPTVWLLYCGSRPLAHWFPEFGSGLATMEDGSPMDRNFLTFLVVLGLLVLLLRETDWLSILRDNRWLFLLFGFMLLSVAWSDYPYVSLKRWVKAFGTVIMGLVVLTGSSPRKTLEAILRRAIYILVPFSVLLVKYYPGLGVDWGRFTGAPMWTGATMSKNTLGVLCMVSVLYLIWAWLRDRAGKDQRPSGWETISLAVTLFMALWLLNGPGGAYSATSVVGLGIGLLTLLALRRFKKDGRPFSPFAYFVLFVGVGCLLAAWLVWGLTPLGIVSAMTGRDETLTGRTDQIWSELIPVAKQHALLGVGYGGFWIRPIAFEKMTVNQAHNGYLDVAVELGAIGLLLLGLFLISSLWRAYKTFRLDHEWASFLTMFLIVSVLHNVTESSFLKSTMLVWNVLLFLMLVTPAKGFSRVSVPTAARRPVLLRPQRGSRGLASSPGRSLR